MTFCILIRWVMGDNRNKPQVGKVTFFKLLVGKVVLGQIISGFIAVTPLKNSMTI